MGDNSETAAATGLTLLDLPPELILEEIGKWVGSREGVVRLAACCKCLREIFLGSKYARNKFEALPWILTYSTSFCEDQIAVHPDLRIFPYVIDVSHLTWVGAKILEEDMMKIGAEDTECYPEYHVRSFPVVHPGSARSHLYYILKGVGFERALADRRSLASGLLTHGTATRFFNGDLSPRRRDLEANPFTPDEQTYIREWAELPLTLWKKYHADDLTIRCMEIIETIDAGGANWTSVCMYGRIDVFLRLKRNCRAVSCNNWSTRCMYFRPPDKDNPLDGKELVMH